MNGATSIEPADPTRTALPDGVRLIDLAGQSDDRGTFTEMFRRDGEAGIDPVQWNAVRSKPGTLRGVHVHLRHWDYLLMAAGSMTLALRDLRAESTTNGLATTIELSADVKSAAVIPPGVAHGFRFRETSIHIYAVSEYWDLADELGCRWDDPALGIQWPGEPSLVSARDLGLPSLDRLLEILAPHQREFC
ncbi:MAG: dTDP-4-dehydrorhamnose 3,5-epimerase family protein [Solirubrobacterales bacterium]